MVAGRPDDCSIADTELRKRISKAFGTPVTQHVTGYPKYERPKDLVQFIVATSSSVVSAVFAVLMPELNQPEWLAAVLIVALIIPIYLLGGWSLKK